MDALGRSYLVPKDPTGVIRATPRQLEVLQFIYRFPFAPSHYIDHYFQSTRFAATIRTRLFSKGYVSKFIKSYDTAPREAAFLTTPKNSWFTTKKGEALLQSSLPTRPFVPAGGWRDHQLYSMLIGTSFAFAAQEIEGLELQYPEQVIDPRNFPLSNDPSPFVIKFDREGKDKLIPDCAPFKMKLGKRYMFFWGFEADRQRATMDAETSSAIVKKFKRQQMFVAADLHFKTFGMKNVNFPFITTNRTHMLNCMDLLKRTVAPNWQEHFIFTVFGDYADNPNFPPPSGSIVRQQWHTTTGPFSILESLKGGSSGY